MANSFSKNKTVIGVALLVLGAGLIIWGYQMSDSIESQLSQTFQGAESDDVMIRYIAGAVSFIAGLFLVLKK